MIVDSSSIMALLLGEPEAEAFVAALASDHAPRLSAGGWIELAAVLTRREGASLFPFLDRLMQRFGIMVAPVTVAQAQIAHDAYRRYGIGSGHAARLNFGDCFAYALAREAGEPLLFKGDDFAQTDIASAVAR